MDTIISFIIIFGLCLALFLLYRHANGSDLCPDSNELGKYGKELRKNWANYAIAILLSATYALTVGETLKISSVCTIKINFAQWGIFTIISFIAVVTLGLFLNELGKKAEQSTQDETEQEQK